MKINSRNMILALFFLFAQNVLAVDELNNCSICTMHTPLDCLTGVAVTRCSHEFCAHCLRQWIETKEEEAVIVRCPLCRATLPHSRHQPIIPTTCRLARRKFWREPSKNTFKKCLEWELKRLALLPINERLNYVYSIQFWRDIMRALTNTWAVLLRRPLLALILYCIYLWFVLPDSRNLLMVSSITLKWPAYLPLAVLFFTILKNHVREFAAIRRAGYQQSFRRLIVDNFFSLWNHMRNSVQENRPRIFSVVFLWLVWAYQSFVYMGMFYNKSILFIVAPFVINGLYQVFTSYHRGNEQGMMRTFPIFVAILYGINEVAFRLLAPIFTSVISPVFNTFVPVVRWGIRILLNLTAGHFIGSTLMGFALVLSKIFFNRRKNN